MSKSVHLLAVLAVIVGSSLASVAAHASTGISPAPAGAEAASGRITVRASGVTTTCSLNVNLTISAVRKAIGSIGGTLVAIRASLCANGATASFLDVEDVVWSYQSFTGTLPTITSVLFRLSNVKVLVTTALSRCLYIGSIGVRYTPPNLYAVLASTLVLQAGASLTTNCFGDLMIVAGDWLTNVNRRLLLI